MQPDPLIAIAWTAVIRNSGHHISAEPLPAPRHQMCLAQRATSRCSCTCARQRPAPAPANAHVHMQIPGRGAHSHHAVKHSLASTRQLSQHPLVRQSASSLPGPALPGCPHLQQHTPAGTPPHRLSCDCILTLSEANSLDLFRSPSCLCQACMPFHQVYFGLIHCTIHRQSCRIAALVASVGLADAMLDITLGLEEGDCMLQARAIIALGWACRS